MHHNVFHVYLNERLFILYTIYFFISAESRKYARRSKSLSPAVVKQHIKTKERKDLSHLPPISQSVDSVDFWKKVFIFNTIISLSSLFQGNFFHFFFILTAKQCVSRTLHASIIHYQLSIIHDTLSIIHYQLYIIRYFSILFSSIRKKDLSLRRIRAWKCR